MHRLIICCIDDSASAVWQFCLWCAVAYASVTFVWHVCRVQPLCMYGKFADRIIVAFVARKVEAQEVIKLLLVQLCRGSIVLQQCPQRLSWHRK